MYFNHRTVFKKNWGFFMCVELFDDLWKSFQIFWGFFMCVELFDELWKSGKNGGENGPKN